MSSHYSSLQFYMIFSEIILMLMYVFNYKLINCNYNVFWSDLGKSLLYLHPFNCSNICSGLDMIGCVLSYFEGTANLHCYTSCTLTTLHCSKVSFLQCCHMKNYNPIFTNMWGVYSLLRYCVCVYVYIYIYIYIYKTTIPFIMFLRGKQLFCAH